MHPAVGTEVFGITGGGGQAELAVVPAGQCATVPSGLDLVAMGGIAVAARQALAACGKQIPYHEVTIGIQGTIKG